MPEYLRVRRLDEALADLGASVVRTFDDAGSEQAKGYVRARPRSGYPDRSSPGVPGLRAQRAGAHAGPSVGAYVFEKVLGEGTTGKVRLAHHVPTGTKASRVLSSAASLTLYGASRSLAVAEKRRPLRFPGPAFHAPPPQRAIKCVKRSALAQLEDAERRLMREFLTMRMLNHPHIARLYEVIGTGRA